MSTNTRIRTEFRKNCSAPSRPEDFFWSAISSSRSTAFATQSPSSLRRNTASTGKMTAAQRNPGLTRGWISAKTSEAAKRCSRVAMPFFRISCAKNSAASATMRMRRSIRGRRFRYLRTARTAMRPNSCWSRGTQRARRQRQLSRQRPSRPASGSCLTRQRGFGFRTAKAASERLLTVTLRFYSARLPGRRSALSKC